VPAWSGAVSQLDMAIEAVKELINATWPTVARKREGSAVQEIGWRELVENSENGELTNQLTPPFATLNWGEGSPTDQFGHVNKIYAYPVIVGYITKKKKANNSKKTAKELREELSGALESLIAAILQEGQAGSSFLCYQASLDLAEANQANDFFDKAKLPFRAGFVRATVYVGSSFTFV
jgi:hypothetical protein